MNKSSELLIEKTIRDLCGTECILHCNNDDSFLDAINHCKKILKTTLEAVQENKEVDITVKMTIK